MSLLLNIFLSGFHSKHWSWYTRCNLTLSWPKLRQDVWYHFWEWERCKGNGLAKLLGIYNSLGNSYTLFDWKCIIIVWMKMMLSVFSSLEYAWCFLFVWIASWNIVNRVYSLIHLHLISVRFLNHFISGSTKVQISRDCQIKLIYHYS